jgi:hypothetical protein
MHMRRILLLAAVTLLGGAQSPDGPTPSDPPAGRITSAEFIRRFQALVQHGDLADASAVARILNVRIGDPVPGQRPPGTRPIVGDEIALPGEAYYEAGPPVSGRRTVPAYLTIGLAVTGPCVTLRDLTEAFGFGFENQRHIPPGIPFYPGGRAHDVDVATYWLQETTPLLLRATFSGRRCAREFLIAQRALQ